ncbi:MAG: CoB--CoM heterodisulfide reductase iron-sulfur subunit B family protein [Deltaproteobacteria bacterium]|nr:CoB--CoM heterodisulfide reductase iron-sulfur subunit B family protein [Deltaproteobacteria bacterium]
MKYAYYPGCAAEAITKEADHTTRMVAQMLGIELVPMNNATCCGAGCLDEANRELSYVINARIFAIAEEMGLNILTICSTCLQTMAKINYDLKSDAELLERTNKVLREVGMEYKGGVEMTHLLWVLAKDYGPQKLRNHVKRPLNMLNIAAFYGCHTLRPGEILGFEDPRNPRSLDLVINALGGHTVEYRGKTRCCGFHTLLVNERASLKAGGKRLQEAKDKGADCMVTPCPLCDISLDVYQGEAEKLYKRKTGLPVFNLSQLVALALGADVGELKFKKHLVSPHSVVEAVLEGQKS